MMPQVLSGARSILSVNGSPFAAGYVLNYDLRTEQYPLYTVDSPLPAELCPDKIMVSLSMRIFRTVDNDPVRLGIAPPADLAGGTLVDKGFTEFNYLTIELRDKLTDQMILYIPKASINSRSGGITAESLLSETISITGIGFMTRSMSSGLIPSVSGLF